MVNSNKEILCTLGPASLNPHVITRLTDLGVNLFRINLSHTNAQDLPEIIKSIQSLTDVPICLDTEGAQVRTGSFEFDIVLKETDIFKFSKKSKNSESNLISLYPYDIYEKLNIGDILTIDFNSAMVQIIEKTSEVAICRVMTGGLIKKNKAVTIHRDINLSSLTDKDIECLKIGLAFSLKHFALSFANYSEDVENIRSIVGSNNFIISKIESIKGLTNLDAILRQSDAIIIDRGDLSREISIEKIPEAQKYIIKNCKRSKTKVYVATNLLESMTHSLSPTRAEVNDIHNTLCDGADGLVLAGETAIGKYPIQCVTMIKKIIKQFQKPTNDLNNSISNIINKESLILPAPHGGGLVYQVIPSFKDIKDHKILNVDIETLMDSEQIAVGALSPLTGFMNEDEIENVLENYKLNDGTSWPLPIFFQINKNIYKKIAVGDEVILKSQDLEEPFAKMTIKSMFRKKLDNFSKKMFGTNDIKHPGVYRLFSKGEYFISGKVELINRLPSKYKHFEILPFEARAIFENKGWNRVVGFHTRNIPHRVHEFIQLSAINEHYCDGLFIHPAVGPKKSGDYLPETIIESYQMLLENNYLDGKTILGAFQNYSRYAGPREAIFTAICRKNFGCSHFILGRDHTGVGDYYSKSDLRAIFSEFDNIGINPIIFDEFVYSKKRKKYVNIKNAKSDAINKISGTEARAMLNSKKEPPDWYIRSEISRYVIKQIRNGKNIFVE